MKLFDRFGFGPHDSIYQFIAYAGAIKMESYIKRYSRLSIMNHLCREIINGKARLYNMTSKIFMHKHYRIRMFIYDHKKNITTIINHELARQERHY